MSDEVNDMSAASRGSRPVAWAITMGPPDDLFVYEARADHQKDDAVALAREFLVGETDKPLPLAPLYFAPTLTDAEREAISAAACICEDAGRTDIAIIVNTALSRLG
jgi:hypothetical protein